MSVAELTGLTLKDLIDAGLHFGHQTKRWNPKMRDFIFDKRNGIHIIDLTQTVPMIEEAAKFLRDTVLSGRKVLFVATKKQAQEAVREAAQSCDQLYMTERWLGGTLTNNQTIRQSVKRMRQIEAMGRNNNGVLSVHKKEASSLRRELDKLQRNLGGIADMAKMPGAIFIVDICREQNALKEAKRLNIPVVAIVDTNADPDPIDYVIPGNDDAVRGIKLIAEAFAKVIKTANEEYARIAAEKQLLKEAERAKEDAANRASRRARQDSKPSEQSDEAKAKLAESRKRAAKAAKAAVDAKVAAVESAKAEKIELAETQAQETAAEAAPDAVAPVMETAVEEAPAAVAPVAETAIEEAPVVETPVEEASTEDSESPAADAAETAVDTDEVPAKAKTAVRKSTAKSAGAVKTTAKKTPAAKKEKEDTADHSAEAVTEETPAAEAAPADEAKAQESVVEDKPVA